MSYVLFLLNLLVFYSKPMPILFKLSYKPAKKTRKVSAGIQTFILHNYYILLITTVVLNFITVFEVDERWISLNVVFLADRWLCRAIIFANFHILVLGKSCSQLLPNRCQPLKIVNFKTENNYWKPLCKPLCFILPCNVHTKEQRTCNIKQLIHSANPNNRTCCPSVRPHFLNLEKQNNRKQCSLLA